jgi:hypothetical protein
MEQAVEAVFLWSLRNHNSSVTSVLVNAKRPLKDV